MQLFSVTTASIFSHPDELVVYDNKNSSLTGLIVKYVLTRKAKKSWFI